MTAANPAGGANRLIVSHGHNRKFGSGRRKGCPAEESPFSVPHQRPRSILSRAPTFGWNPSRSAILVGSETDITGPARAASVRDLSSNAFALADPGPTQRH